MRTFTSEQLLNMEIINLCDGTRLGCAEGLEFDIDPCGCTPTLTALLVPCASGISALFSFGRRECWRIPWKQVECIGRDAILVRLTDSDLTSCRFRPER